MPINPVRHNRTALSLAQEVLVEQAPLLLADPACFVDGTGRLGMLPIYSMPAKQLAARLWNRGWRSGWRYYWTHPALRTGIVVEILRLGERKARVGAISHGEEAVRLRRTLAELHANYAADRRRYRPRILRLPWIGMEALWLNTDSLRIPDRFISRLDDLENGRFVEEAVRRARAFAAR